MSGSLCKQWVHISSTWQHRRPMCERAGVSSVCGEGLWSWSAHGLTLTTGRGRNALFRLCWHRKRRGRGTHTRCCCCCYRRCCCQQTSKKFLLLPLFFPPPPFMFRMENRRGRNGNQRFFHVSGSEAEGGEKGGRKRKEFFPEKEGETTEKKPVHLFFLLEE